MLIELSVIIVSFNTSKLLQECLSSVYKATKFGNIEDISEVIVVDNASTDGSVEMVKKLYPKVKLIQNKINKGFARANNQGINLARGKFILLLNSDTKIKQGSLVSLFKAIKIDSKIGVVGGKLLNPDGSIQPSFGYFPTLTRIFLWMTFLDDLKIFSKIIKSYHVEDKSWYTNKQEVDWVTGACMLVRKEVVDSAGVLDEKIFMYGEEMEWCYRVKKEGFRIIYTPDAEIFHIKGASSKSLSASGIVEEFKSLLYFYKKHKPYWQLILSKWLLMFGALLRIVVFGIIGKYPDRLHLYAKAFDMVRR